MRSVSPPESTHALDLAGLRSPGVTFWSVVDGETVVACGALKELDAGHAEIKSMRTAPSHKKCGVASWLLEHMIVEARKMGYSRLSLETGSSDFFAPARGLYAKHGFRYCAPFADYKADPNSVFMTKVLTATVSSR
jgi:putative acetyltransferase